MLRSIRKSAPRPARSRERLCDPGDDRSPPWFPRRSSAPELILLGSIAFIRCAFGFGSSDREHSARCYVSELHSKSTAGVHGSSPGPAYRPVSSMGNQATSRGTTAPQWGFGKANRFKGLCDNGIPGPGAYAI